MHIYVFQQLIILFAYCLQTIETDVATSALYFTVGDEDYLVITNFGSYGRFETRSRVYTIQMDGTLKVLQDLFTKGAMDVVFFAHTNQQWLLIANYIDNSGQTAIDSDIYQWDADNKRLSSVPTQYIQTRGALAAVIINMDDMLLLAIANNYDNTVNKYQIKLVFNTLYYFYKSILLHIQIL